jgi:non-ribosomal peptide synthetase component F/acyl carrier protein
MVEHRQVVNMLYFRRAQYGMRAGDRALQLFSYAFDGFVTSCFTPLASGALLIQPDSDESRDVEKLKELIVRLRVTHFIAVPPLYRVLIQSLSPGEARCLRVATLAGDSISPGLLELTKEKNPGLEIVNEYGVTEAAVMSTIQRRQEKDSRVTIGKPIANTVIYILDRWWHLQPVGVSGELTIGGAGVARGYVNRPELTAEKFLPDPYRSYMSYRSYRSKKRYKTGDLARWLADGRIEFTGRIDHQVKIRGFRIEIGEIESRLSGHQEIKEAAVMAVRDERGDKSLCAYVVPSDAGALESGGDMPARLRDYLSQALPGYMVPSFFVLLDRMPLTSNGKLDRRALPAPVTRVSPVSHSAPRDMLEQGLAKIWSEVLKLENTSIGIHDNFFELGGHSLNAAVMASRVYKDLGVKISLAALFRRPTIARLAEFLKGETGEEFKALEPAPVTNRDYYPISFAQKRLYILQQAEPGSTAYNMPVMLKLEGALDGEKLENIFRQLIRRHESLRTSFHISEGKPVQKIHGNVDFKINYYTAPGEREEKENIRHFIKPFDLSQAPLLRVELMETCENRRILMVDMHHTITDGTSMGIFVREFMALYAGGELSPVRIQYKDFVLWKESKEEKEALEKQEAYWLKEFDGEVPLLDLPIDYPRSRSVDGNIIEFQLTGEESRQLRDLAADGGVTMFMVFLAIYNILLSKITGQEDIVVGTPAAGRGHSDLERTIGMFVNTLALRNYPKGDKNVTEFLAEIRERSLQAFENQDYPFEDLAEKVALDRDANRNPVFDVMFTYLNIDIPEVEIPGLRMIPYEYEKPAAKFELTLNARELEGIFTFSLEYRTALFKEETINEFVEFFKEITSAIIGDRCIKLKDIDISTHFSDVESSIYQEVEGDLDFEF